LLMAAELCIDLKECANPVEAITSMGFKIINIFKVDEISSCILVISGDIPAINELLYVKSKRPKYIISATKRWCIKAM